MSPEWEKRIFGSEKANYIWISDKYKYQLSTTLARIGYENYEDLVYHEEATLSTSPFYKRILIGQPFTSKNSHWISDNKSYVTAFSDGHNQ